MCYETKVILAAIMAAIEDVDDPVKIKRIIEKIANIENVIKSNDETSTGSNEK